MQNQIRKIIKLKTGRKLFDFFFFFGNAFRNSLSSLIYYYYYYYFHCSLLE